MSAPLEVLAVNESKLDNTITDGEIHIPGYVITRKDRNRHGGGVALYIKEDISFSVRHDLAPAQLETICLEINLPYNRSFLVSTWYRPPSANINLFEDYAKFLEKCDNTNKQLLVLGDMNCDYFKNPPDSHTQKLQFLSSIYQLQQLISEPTRVTNMSATLIDLIFTNESHNISKSGVIHIGVSDHSLIYAVRKFIPNKRGQIKKEVRNLKHFVKEDFIYDLLKPLLPPWEMVETINDPNLAWRVWETNFNEVLNWHAPLRHQRVRQSSIPWLNSNIKNLMRKRDYHKKQSVKYNSEHHWRLYQSFRNNVNIQLRKSKSHYYRQKIGECKKNDPKTTWTLINTLIGRSSSSKHINEVKVDNVTFMKIYLKPLMNSLLTFALN